MAPVAILLSLAIGGAAGTITPSGPTVPANLLRIEVYFDRPLPSIAARDIVLRDGKGQRIDEALLDIALPDREGRTLVILMQPGRIKHGLGPNLAAGPALHEGGQISIELSDPRLAHPLKRTWRVVAPAEQRLAVASWQVRTPAAATRAPLVLALPSVINGGAAPMIAIAGDDGKRIPGQAVLGAGESEWRFVPAAPWKTGVYQLRVHPALEDPAGNRLCAAFEERLQSERDCTQEASMPFRIGLP